MNLLRAGRALALFVVAIATANAVVPDCARADDGEHRTGRHERRTVQAGGHEDDDRHEELLRWRQRRDILPFDDILRIFRTKIGGEIIETEVEMKNGRPRYEIKYIDAAGRVREAYVDARSGAVLNKGSD